MPRPMTEIEKQIDTIRKLHGVPMSCPACQMPTSIWQASGMDPAAYNGRNHPKEFRCPHCGVKLEYLVPVFSVEPYIWRIAEPVIPASREREEPHCDRCGAGGVALTMSRFNRQMICLACEAREKRHPAYPAAAQAELDAVRRGEVNFPGVGKPDDL